VVTAPAVPADDASDGSEIGAAAAGCPFETRLGAALPSGGSAATARLASSQTRTSSIPRIMPTQTITKLAIISRCVRVKEDCCAVSGDGAARGGAAGNDVSRGVHGWGRDVSEYGVARERPAAPIGTTCGYASVPQTVGCGPIVASP
jgi:hypothetical protein